MSWGSSCGAQGVFNDCYSYFRDRSLGTAEASRGSRSQSITLLLGPPRPQKGCDLMARVLVERCLGGEAQWSWVAVALCGPTPSLVDPRRLLLSARAPSRLVVPLQVSVPTASGFCGQSPGGGLLIARPSLTFVLWGFISGLPSLSAACLLLLLMGCVSATAASPPG